MRRIGELIMVGVLAVVMIALTARQSRATTVCGSVITNVASATVVPFAGVPSGEVTYSVTATVLVKTPGLSLVKNANVTVQSPGGTVTFCITVINDGCASAFGVVVSDYVPDNMEYVGNSTEWVRGAAPVEYLWYSPPATTWFPPPSRPNLGVAEALLVWRVNVVGPGRSGYLCYRASVQ